MYNIIIYSYWFCLHHFHVLTGCWSYITWRWISQGIIIFYPCGFRCVTHHKCNLIWEKLVCKSCVYALVVIIIKTEMIMIIMKRTSKFVLRSLCYNHRVNTQMKILPDLKAKVLYSNAAHSNKKKQKVTNELWIVCQAAKAAMIITAFSTSVLWRCSPFRYVVQQPQQQPVEDRMTHVDILRISHTPKKGKCNWSLVRDSDNKLTTRLKVVRQGLTTPLHPPQPLHSLLLPTE